MSNDKYIEIIRNQAATPTSIKPVIKHINGQTTNTSLFVVEQFGNKFIYKISDPKTSFNNLMLAQLLLKNDIPVPDSKIFISNHQYFEKYKIISGTTLAEAQPENIKQILYEILILAKKISEIKLTDKTISEDLVLSTRRKKHHLKDFGKLLTNIHYQIHKRQTTYGNVTLNHADLNPSNILLDNNNHVIALLDLDSLAICDEYTMLSQIILYWHISPDIVAQTYQSVFNQKLNINHLKYLLLFRKIKCKISTQLRKIKKK